MIFYEKMAAVKRRQQYFSFLLQTLEGDGQDLQRDGEIFFFVVDRQGVERNFEWR